MNSYKPKKSFIQLTRELITKNIKSEKVSLLGLNLFIDSEVFNPDIFFSSQWFGLELEKIVTDKKILIEIGCGTGIVSLYCAKNHPNLFVHATDINPRARDLTKLNAEINGIEDRVRTYSGDVFSSISKDIKADVIFWALPFGYLEETDILDNRDWQVFDPGYRAIKIFFSEAKEYLKLNGRIFFGFSIDIGHFDLIQEIASENNLKLNLLIKTTGIEKGNVSMEIWEAIILNKNHS